MSQRYNFPKVELHSHLEGCARIQSVVEVAKKRGISIPTYDLDELKNYVYVPKRMTLEQYLEKFDVLLPVFAGDADALVRLIKEAVEDKKKDGVTYVEFRYWPHLLANCDVEPLLPSTKERGRIRPKDVVEIINKAAAEAEEEFNVKVRTILTYMAVYRGWGLETAQLCREYSNLGVVGFDIANMHGEGEYIAEGISAFQYCKSNGIHRTAHAGESGDANQVKMAVEQMDAERIGHGYHVVDDDEVYKRCKDRGIHFEVCPWSSFLTSSVPEDWNAHPANRFFKDDVNFSLNTDDPGMQMKSLLDNYDVATRYFGFTENDLQKLNLNAAQSCFLDAPSRQELVGQLKKEYGFSNAAS